MRLGPVQSALDVVLPPGSRSPRLVKKAFQGRVALLLLLTVVVALAYPSASNALTTTNHHHSGAFIQAADFDLDDDSLELVPYATVRIAILEPSTETLAIAPSHPLPAVSPIVRWIRRACPSREADDDRSIG